MVPESDKQDSRKSGSDSSGSSTGEKRPPQPNHDPEMQTIVTRKRQRKEEASDPVKTQSRKGAPDAR